MDDLLQQMIEPEPAQRDTPRRRRLVSTVAILALALAGTTSLVTSALFTDQDTTDSGITTGSVNLTAGETSTAVLPPAGFAPGGFAFAPLTIANDGSLALRYAVSYGLGEPEAGTSDPGDIDGTGDGDLRDVLTLDVYATATCTAAGTAAATLVGSDAGTGANPLASLGAPTPIVGNPGPDADPGDRQINAGAADDALCVRIGLPITAGNEYQNLAADIVFTFDAVQVVNNP